MEPIELETKEDEITLAYRVFLGEVKEAFDRHCDEIRTHTREKLNGVPEDDEEGRQKVLTEEQAELDKTLAELKELLAKRELQVRQQLEEIETMREQREFNFDDELAGVESGSKHAA